MSISFSIDAVNSALSFIAKSIDYIKTNVVGHVADTSLTSVTKITRAEPLTVISQDCGKMEELPSICSLMLNLFASYYLQGAAIMTRVNNVEVVRVLDALNPNRDSTGFLIAGRNSVTENAIATSTEQMRFSLLKPVAEAASGESGMFNAETKFSEGNLAIGKMLNVPITTVNAEGNECTLNIPISVRLATRFLNNESLINIFTHKKMDLSLVERGRAAMEGRISFIKDFIFCQDLIKEYRRAAIKDKSGTLQEIYKRAQNNRSYGLLTKNPSLQIASSIYILSREAAMEIEGRVGAKFSSASGRQKLLKDTYAMIICVVEPEWEELQIYFNGIADATTVKFRMLKDLTGKKDVDIADVMKTLMAGQVPSF